MRCGVKLPNVNFFYQTLSFHLFFSSSYEVTEDHVLASLQNIFCVHIPGSNPNSSSEAVSTFLKIFDESENWSSLRQEKGNIAYQELISDIISQVLVNISQGKSNHSNHLNTGQVWHLNGSNMSGCQMV